jgi:hypothetical protein
LDTPGRHEDVGRVGRVVRRFTLDAFVRDRTAATTQPVSVRGAESIFRDIPTAVSADGSAMVFSSISSQLVPGDAFVASDLFMPTNRRPHCTTADGDRGVQPDRGRGADAEHGPVVHERGARTRLR